MLHPDPLGPDGFAALTGVSRETLERLKRLLDALERWNRAHDLVGASTLADPWRRHILDSWQLTELVPEARRWCDLGAGAGFPGLVVAAALGEAGHVRLIDSNGKRCAFLRETARLMAVSVDVVHGRIEDIPATVVDVVTARALAPLPRLLGWIRSYLDLGAAALLLKGEDVAAECADTPDLAAYGWSATISRSDPRGRILHIAGRTP